MHCFERPQSGLQTLVSIKKLEIKSDLGKALKGAVQWSGKASGLDSDGWAMNRWGNSGMSSLPGPPCPQLQNKGVG